MQFLRALFFASIGLQTCSAIAQVQIDVAARSFKSEDVIHAKVSNKGALPVSYCVEFGQTSPGAGTLESTPTPFNVEKLNGEKWGALMIGPDVGSSRHAVELVPGSSQDFPFRLRDPGIVRLVLHYWIGKHEDVCSGMVKRRKITRSKVFSIVGN